MVVTDVLAHSHIECDFWISTFCWEAVRQPVLICYHSTDINNYIPETQSPERVLSCILPVFPCNAAAQHRSHTCGGGSSCRLCSGGRVSPYFPPGTPHAWLLCLIHTDKEAMSGAGIKLCSYNQTASYREKKQRRWKYCPERRLIYLFIVFTLLFLVSGALPSMHWEKPVKWHVEHFNRDKNLQNATHSVHFYKNQSNCDWARRVSTVLISLVKLLPVCRFAVTY